MNKTIKRSSLFGLFLILIADQAFAVNIIAAYEKDTFIGTDIFQKVGDLSEPVMKIEFDLEKKESLVFFQKNDLMRTEHIDGYDHKIDMLTDWYLFHLRGSSGVARESLQEIFDNAHGQNSHIIEEVSIENAKKKTRLETKVNTRSLDGAVKEVNKRQRFDKMIPGAKECANDLYNFKGRDYKNMLGCGLIKDFEKKRLVKTGKFEDYVIDMHFKGAETQLGLVVSCEVYELGEIVARQAAGFSILESKICIGMHNGVPIAYYKNVTSQLGNTTPTKVSYRLRFLEFDKIVDNEIFDIEKSKVCSDALVVDERTRC